MRPGYTCEEIESGYSVNVAQLQAWNTWQGSNCDMNLYANMTVDEDYQGNPDGLHGSDGHG